jgi:hypothetical protein
MPRISRRSEGLPLGGAGWRPAVEPQRDGGNGHEHRHAQAAPHPCGDEVDDCGGVLVAWQCVERLAAEEVFDEMPPLVFFSVMLGVSAGPLAERNDGLHVVRVPVHADSRHQISYRRLRPSNRCRP